MRKICLLAVLATLGGCSGGDDAAVAACAEQVASRLTGKSFVIDRSAMAANATQEDGGVINITSKVTFDAGLPGEYSQDFECKARNADGRVDVISVTFNW